MKTVRKTYTLAILIPLLAGVILLSLIYLGQFGRTVHDLSESSVDLMRKNLLDQYQARAEILAFYQAELLVNPLYFNDFEAIDRIVTSGRGVRDLKRITVFDAQRNILHDGSENFQSVQTPMTDEMSRHLVETGTTQVRIRDNELEVAAPVKINGTLLGGVKIVFSLDPIFRDLNDLAGQLDELSSVGRESSVKPVVLALLVLSLLAVLTSLALSKRLTDPIVHLAKVASRIGKGDYGVEIRAHRPDEIGRLTEAIDLMRSQVRDRDRLLANQSELLEQKVIEKTEDLKRVNEQLEQELDRRKRIQTELKEASENFKSLFELNNRILDFSPIGILKLNETQNIVYENPEMRRIFGVPDGENSRHLGMGFGDLFPDQKSKVERELVDLHRGKCISFELSMKTPDGRNACLAVRGVPIDTLDHRMKEAVIIILDVTDRKTAEETKRHLENQIRHAQKLESLGILAGGVAHDFNNLLMTILAQAELARDELSEVSPARHNIQEIERTAKRAGELSNQMLAYSGKGKFAVEPIRLNDLVREMVQMLNVSISPDVTVILDLQDDLPLTEGDPTQIRQVIMNLLTNATESLGKRPGTITIRTRLWEPTGEQSDLMYLDETVPGKRYLNLEVSDTGMGMDKWTLEKVFDPFFTTKFTGRGLGMAMVLGIVRGHRGAVQVQSEPGMGSTFKILLPVVGTSPLSPGWTEDPAEETFLFRGTVLFIEDDESIRLVMEKILRRLGFEVVTAENGEEGIQKFRDRMEEIVLVILDLMMPVMDGEECFSRIREIRRDVPVIISSGYSEYDVGQRFSDQEGVEVIQKPFRRSKLVGKIRDLLEKESV